MLSVRAHARERRKIARTKGTQHSNRTPHRNQISSASCSCVPSIVMLVLRCGRVSTCAGTACLRARLFSPSSDCRRFCCRRVCAIHATAPPHMSDVRVNVNVTPLCMLCCIRVTALHRARARVFRWNLSTKYNPTMCVLL